MKQVAAVIKPKYRKSLCKKNLTFVNTHISISFRGEFLFGEEEEERNTYISNVTIESKFCTFFFQPTLLHLLESKLELQEKGTENNPSLILFRYGQHEYRQQEMRFIPYRSAKSLGSSPGMIYCQHTMRPISV